LSIRAKDVFGRTELVKYEREVKEGEANVDAGGRLRLPVRAGGVRPRVFRAVKLTIEIIDDHLL
jgi:hypothetical protein